jgi:16S rRNA C967 or C1407 C5-methylase (RsmB/RsmF family)
MLPDAFVQRMKKEWTGDDFESFLASIANPSPTSVRVHAIKKHKIPTEKPYNNVFSLCEKSMKWIEENNPPKEMEVEFTVFCNCHYDEKTNTATHGLLAKLNND